MTPRHQDVLYDIVETYISDGEPVASRTIVRRRGGDLSVDERVGAQDLESIRNYINRNFGGWALEDIRRALAARLEHAEATYDAILSKLTLLYAKGLLEVGPEPEVHMEGASNLAF